MMYIKAISYEPKSQFQVDPLTDAKKRERYKGLLAKITVFHVSMAYQLYEIYSVLAKGQHGVCKINQLPWHFQGRIKHLKDDLEAISKDSYEGPLKEEKAKLNEGLFITGTLIVTEERRPTRSGSASDTSANIVKLSKETIKKFINRLTSEISDRISDNPVVDLMKETFVEFKPDSLHDLLKIANSSGRHYGQFENLKKQLAELEKRYKNTDAIDEMARWLMIFTKKNLFNKIPDILHFALCCFMKSPLEATAETLGSVINQHGSKQRQSLKPASLSNEVQISWNGPFEHSAAAERLLDRSLDAYFNEHTKSGAVRFHVSSKFKFMSSTIRNYLKKRSRIDF